MVAGGKIKWTHSPQNSAWEWMQLKQNHLTPSWFKVANNMHNEYKQRLLFFLWHITWPTYLYIIRHLAINYDLWNSIRKFYQPICVLLCQCHACVRCDCSFFHIINISNSNHLSVGIFDVISWRLIHIITHEPQTRWNRERRKKIEPCRMKKKKQSIN